MIVRWEYYKRSQNKTVGLGHIHAAHNLPSAASTELFRVAIGAPKAFETFTQGPASKPTWTLEPKMITESG